MNMQCKKAIEKQNTKENILEIVINPVDGSTYTRHIKFYSNYCHVLRNEYSTLKHFCGPEGKWFEPKISVFKKIKNLFKGAIK